MNVKEKISDVFTNHNLMHIATVDENGAPKVRGVDFVAGGKENEIYFVTRRDSNKVRHIQNNAAVSIAIDHDCPSMEDLKALRYVKAIGKAELVDTDEESNRAMAWLIKKFPFLGDIPGEPQDMACVRVSLNQIILVDNTVAFGHEETCNYD